MGRVEFSILLYDLAHVGSKTLQQADRIATEIFSNAGVNVRFATVSLTDPSELLTDFTARPASGCTQPLASAVLRAQILPHAPVGLPRGTLGYALPCARRGVQVTLFADSIEEVSHNAYTPSFCRVLGHVLAHEVGHVLLRSEAHTQDGLMKALWTRSDWQRAAVLAIGFNSEQQQRIVHELRAVQAYGDLDTANANVISSAGLVSAKRPFGMSD
jgi:hypothetical protein